MQGPSLCEKISLVSEAWRPDAPSSLRSRKFRFITQHIQGRPRYVFRVLAKGDSALRVLLPRMLWALKRRPCAAPPPDSSRVHVSMTTRSCMAPLMPRKPPCRAAAAPTRAGHQQFASLHCDAVTACSCTSASLEVRRESALLHRNCVLQASWRLQGPCCKIAPALDVTGGCCGVGAAHASTHSVLLSCSNTHSRPSRSRCRVSVVTHMPARTHAHAGMVEALDVVLVYLRPYSFVETAGMMESLDVPRCL